MENIKRVICVFFLFIYNGLLSIGTNSFDCDFDEGICGWTQDKSDDFDWTWLSGKTPTSYTGPQYDHTTGVGHYVYTDTSEVAKNKKARLVSPQEDPGEYCLSFWYYMYGRHVSRLSVFNMEGTDLKDELLSMTGNKGRKWILKQIQVNTDEPFKIVVEGRVRNSNNHGMGDIAIDDIVMFSSAKCPTDCGDPTPEFGLVNSKNFNIGSSVQMSCETGYTMSGSPSIICQANGSWSDRPECQPVDFGSPHFARKIIVRTSEGTTYNKKIMLSCEEGFSLVGNAFVTCRADGNWTLQPKCVIKNCDDPTPVSGIVNDTDFQYGSVIEVKCNRGFTINGRSSITCQANATWSHRPVCDQIDCGTRNITNGLFNASLGTKFGKIATQSCNIGYYLEGDKEISCKETGWNGTFAKCIVVECATPFVTNGIPAETPNGTTFTMVAVFACTDSYTMIGNASVTCQADGNWTTLPYCISEDSEVSPLIAVYITIPLVVLCVVILLTACLLRKRYTKGNNTKHVTDTHPIVQYPNEIYNEYAIPTHAERPETDGSMSPDEDYVVIDHDRKNEASENIYYNTSEADCSEKDFGHHYDHTMKTSKPAIDMNYSHITGNVTDKPFKPSYDKVNRPDTNDKPVQSDAQRESESYDHINLKCQSEDMKQELSIKTDEVESNYDHANAGGIDPVVLEQDEYSHLNDENIIKLKNNEEELSTAYECQYSNFSESTENTNRKHKERKAEYEEPVSHTPQYFILEKNKNESEDVQNKFVLEVEENCYENDASCNHDYFVLEKNESLM